MKESVRILRKILSEIRKSTSDKRLTIKPIVPYLFREFKKNVVTDGQVCRQLNELKFIADTYQCYLQSSRLVNEIRCEFHGLGERTVSQTASMVGFKLPQEPK